MRKCLLLNLFLILTALSWAQTYTVGVQSVTWTDASRSNRSVPVEFHYPGTNSTIANDSFPIVVFGHGFDMAITSYYPWADSLATRGYIVALTSNEGGLSPSHTNLAQDLIYIYNNIISQSGTNSSSLLYHKVIAKGAIGGHSMGGGCTVLSCQYSDMATCYFTFAAATTTPSSITAAPSMYKPYLSFAGSNDCIAPPSTNQRPMYDSSSSVCKTFIEIKNATHCQFAASDIACNFGEGVSGCASTPLSRTSQINQTLSFLVPYLDYYTKGICSAWTLFHTRYVADITDTTLTNCNNIVPSNPSISGTNSFCSGSNTILTTLPSGFSYLWSNGATNSSIQVSSAGTYSFTVSNGVCSLNSSPESVTMKLPPATPTSITGPDTVCSQAASINIFVANDTAASNYRWSLPSGWVITSGDNTNAIVVTSGNAGGSISVVAQNSCDSSSRVQKTIVVVPSNLGVPDTISGLTNICSGQTIQYLVTPVNGAASYLWTIPAGWSANGNVNNNTITLVAGSNTGNIQVQAQNGCGLSIPSSLAVNVRVSPSIGAVSGTDSICGNNTQPLIFNINNVSNADSLVWGVPANWSLSSGQNTASITVNAHHTSGVVSVIGSNTCGATNSSSISVAVLDTPQTSITRSNNSLTADSANAYQWYLDGNIIPGATSQTYVTTQSGIYTVDVRNEFNCTGSSAGYSYTYLSVNDIRDDHDMSIFPNPAQGGNFELSVNESLVGGEFNLYDATGRKVYHAIISGTLNSVMINNLSSGIYIASIETRGKQLRKKLVIQN